MSPLLLLNLPRSLSQDLLLLLSFSLPDNSLHLQHCCDWMVRYSFPCLNISSEQIQHLLKFLPLLLLSHYNLTCNFHPCLPFPCKLWSWAIGHYTHQFPPYSHVGMRVHKRKYTRKAIPKEKQGGKLSLSLWTTENRGPGLGHLGSLVCVGQNITDELCKLILDSRYICALCCLRGGKDINKIYWVCSGLYRSFLCSY